MENYKTVVALAKIKELRKAEKYGEAYEIIKTLNFKKINDIMDCNMLADVCTEVGDFEIGKLMYEKIYKKTHSRHSLGSLVYMDIKLKDAAGARELLEKYNLAAPTDPMRLIYKFRIEKLEKAPISQQIETLEAWKTEDYSERWAAELAKLYHKSGNDEKCLAECDKIITWFGEGEYVDWARALKAHLNGEIDLTELAENGEKIDIPEKVEQPEAPVTGETAEASETTEAPADEKTAAEIPAAEIAAENKKTAEELENTVIISPAPTDDFSDFTVNTAGVIEPEETSEEHEEEPVNSDDEVHEISAPVPDGSKSGNAELELETMENIMKFLAENNSTTVRLREKDEEKPVIAGTLGNAINSGEVVLEDLFGNYARIEAIRKQLIRSLNMLFDPLKHGENFIITGGAKSGRTTLAKKLAKAASRYGLLKSTKALLTDAEKLNRVNLENQGDRLADCTVIIENAGKLHASTVKALLAVGAEYAGRTLIFLEDQRKNINTLLRDNPELNSVYNNRIHLPSEYRVEDLKGFAYEYLYAKEYELEIPADGAPEERITAILDGKSKDAIRETIDLVKAAIDKADKRNGLMLADMMQNGKMENAEIMSVKAEDFE